MVLADNVDGGDDLDLIVTTMNGNVFCFSTPLAHHPLKVCASADVEVWISISFRAFCCLSGKMSCQIDLCRLRQFQMMGREKWKDGSIYVYVEREREMERKSLVYICVCRGETRGGGDRERWRESLGLYIRV